MKKTTYVIHMPAGISQSHFEAKQQELEQYFNGHVEFAFNKNLIMTVVENNLKSYYPFEFKQTENPLEVYMGMSDEGPYYLNIEKSQHIVVGGATDSGKSSGMLGMALSLALNSHNLDLHIHDFQNITFGMFADCRKVKSYGVTAKEFEKLLDEMKTESERRLAIFRSVKNKVYIEKLSAWNKEFPDKAIPFKVVIVDEYGALSDSELEVISEKFRMRVQMDRKAGIHYIIALHRCSVDLLPGSVKNNMPTRIAFRCASQTDSKVILDEDGAEKLRFQGRFLIKNYDGLKEVQALYIEPKHVEKILKKHKAYKTIEEKCLEKNLAKREVEAEREEVKRKFHETSRNAY